MLGFEEWRSCLDERLTLNLIFWSWLWLRRTVRVGLGVVEDGIGCVRVALVVEHLGRVALADDIERLLDVLEHDLATLLEARHLYLDYLSNAPLVVSEVFDALIVLDQP